jgi:hypothetical protein
MKASDKRKSGITLIGDLPWGSHFCRFYTTKKDLLDVLIPYFKAGLENNEFCVWVTSDFFTKEQAIKALKKSVPDFSDYLAGGRMEIFPYTDWYLIGLASFKDVDMGKIAREAADLFDEDLKKWGGSVDIWDMPLVEADETQDHTY